MKASHIIAIIIIGAGILCVFGAMGTWLDVQSPFGSISATGTDTPRGNEFIGIGIAMVVAGLIGLAPTSGWRVLSGVASALLGVGCFFYARDTKDTLTDAIKQENGDTLGFLVSTGQGLSMLTVASILAFIAGIAAAYVAAKEAPEPPARDTQPYYPPIDLTKRSPAPGSPEAYFTKRWGQTNEQS